MQASNSISIWNNPPSNFSGGSYLLDDYPAAAAYSLRQLKTGVTNVVRVRRSSDSAESDFTADEITDGTLTTWTGANDGFIATWYDQETGTSYDVTQGTAANQPQIVSSGSVMTKGGLPAIDFDGTDLLTYSSQVYNSTDISIFTVSSNDNSGQFYGIVTSNLSGSIPQNGITVLNDRRTQKRNLYVRASGDYYANLSAQINDANQRLLVGIIDSSKNMSAFDNSTTGGTATYVGTPTNNYLVIGKYSASNNLVGQIQEVIIFNTDETSNRTDIEDNMNDYFSIY